jgi:hypothetical protein
MKPNTNNMNKKPKNEDGKPTAESREAMEKKRVLKTSGGASLAEFDKAMEKKQVLTPAAEYSERVAKLGSDLRVADMLGTQPLTIGRRRSGATVLTREHFLALSALESDEATDSPI